MPFSPATYRGLKQVISSMCNYLIDLLVMLEMTNDHADVNKSISANCYYIIKVI